MEEIGRRLQATRVAKGLTLQEVEDETRIRKKYIEALEAGRTVLIPGDVYVKGFLRTYGNYLGLDGEGLVEEYKAGSTAAEDSASTGQEVERPRSRRERNRGQVDQPTTVAAAEVEADADEPIARPLALPSQPPRPPAFVSPPPRVGSRRAERVGRRNRTPAGRTPGPLTYLFRRLLVGLVVLVPLVGGGYWLWDRMANAPAPEPPPVNVAPQEPPVTPTPPPVEPTPAPAPTPTPPPKPTITMTGPKGIEVDLRVSVPEVELKMEFTQGQPWLEVYGENGERLFYALAKDPLTFKGKKFRVRVGFMEGFKMELNGVSVSHGLEGGPYDFIIRGE